MLCEQQWFFIRCTLTHLARPCFKVIFDHPYFKDIGGMAYHWSYCDWLIAADVAVQPFYAVQAERSRNPKPGLRENSKVTSRAFHFVFSNFKTTWMPAEPRFSSTAEQHLITSNLHTLPHAEIQACYGGLVSLTGSIFHRHKWFQS